MYNKLVIHCSSALDPATLRRPSSLVIPFFTSQAIQHVAPVRDAHESLETLHYHHRGGR